MEPAEDGFPCPWNQIRGIGGSMKHPISQRTVKISALKPVYELYHGYEDRDKAVIGKSTVAKFNTRD